MEYISVFILIFALAASTSKYTEHTYLIYFETQFTITANNHKWKSIIDNTSNENWYIQNKNKWGNKKYI